MTASPQVGALKESLLAAGVVRETSVPGLYQRSKAFEDTIRGIETMVHRAGAGLGEVEPMYYLPPVMPRETFLRTDYLRSFPDLIGSVHTFAGGDAEHAELLRLAEDDGDWTEMLTPSEVTLASAACHPVYPFLSGQLPQEGRLLEVQGFCFRHEPSDDPARMQVFRQHELIRVGTPEQALAHRDAALDLGLELLGSLDLPVSKVVANDPFFGRAGRMLAKNQRETTLKYEIVCPVTSTENPTAIASSNYHLEHFGAPFEITTADGEVAHSACIGFGLERVALALFATHGLDPDAWPDAVRGRLWP